jgi:hypothetical protein
VSHPPISAVRGYLLLCSHMRAYTTLLGHILGSHPEITGYAEMHLRLRNQQELHQLARQVARQSGKDYRQRYVFDNLLHDHLPIAGKVLRRPDLYPLVMVREPVATIESILRLQARYIHRVEVAEQYYIGRLQRLQQLILQCRGKALVVQGEALVEDSERVLRRLSGWLQLQSPLRSDYQRFQHTGKRRLGDSSAHIHSGRILTDAERSSGRAALLETGAVARSEQAYRAFMEFVSVEVAADKTVLA